MEQLRRRQSKGAREEPQNLAFVRPVQHPHAQTPNRPPVASLCGKRAAPCGPWESLGKKAFFPARIGSFNNLRGALLADQSTTVLTVEQNVKSALKISDEAIALESGRLVLQKPASELLTDPHIDRWFLGGAHAAEAAVPGHGAGSLTLTALQWRLAPLGFSDGQSQAAEAPGLWPALAVNAPLAPSLD